MNTGATLVEKTKIFDYQLKEIADQNQFNDYIDDKETLNILRKNLVKGQNNIITLK